ncbi:MAG: hypothetical protein QQW96_03820 [Tychonema bourrellyi B0820]|nr:hypothetical protein [Tychonema bourrellyi B0820]PJE45234.1 MAG: hypothetical protein CUR32_01135 [Flavobacterium sp.] [Flavobacterium sp. FEMGT703F]
MKNITFAGIQGKVIESSPHGNYLVVRLNDRITICGTFTNIWNWEEMSDISSGFESFITYIGVRSNMEAEAVRECVAEMGGYFRQNEEEPRRSKRVKAFPLELKIRGLTNDFVAEFVAADED